MQKVRYVNLSMLAIKVRLKEDYQKQGIKVLGQELGVRNPLALPRLVKIILSMGVGKALEDKAELQKASKDLELIAGQKPKITRAKKAISAFKLRKGDEIGLMVTLRGERMYQFLDKFFRIVLPRMRDFRGLSKKSLDQSGNFSFGLTEQTVFPEINPSKVDRARGLQITIVTTAKDDIQGLALLKVLGGPFER